MLVDHYVSYCNNFDHAIQALDECKEKSEKFRKFLETTGGVKRVKKYQLAAFLTLPVQRLPRYILLLRDLVKHTHPSHPDATSLRAGLEKIQWAVSQIDKAKTKNETKKQRGRLQQKFLEPASVSVSFPLLSHQPGETTAQTPPSPPL